jgi:hypothetical protein
VAGEAEVSTTPTIVNRFPFEPHIADMPPQQQYVIRNLWNAVFDAQSAIPILKTQIDANKSAISTTNETVNNNSSSETIIQVVGSDYGTVNNQTGNTVYATAQSDAGGFVILSDASPIAVTLTAAPVITLPWACMVFNEGAGLVTTTPASGTISFPGSISAASMTIPQYFGAAICFDGVNFYAILFPVSPQNTPVISNQFLTAFNSTTGVFSQAQPTIANVSGLATALALLAPSANPTFTGTVTEPSPSVLTAATTAISATAGAAGALPSAPLGYLEWSVNGVIVKVPYYSV